MTAASQPRTASPLANPAGRPVSVVHLTAEYTPFARTGGLGEAVRGLAEFQHAAGIDVSVILPLYRTVRDEAPDLQAVGNPFSIQLGSRTEEFRIFRPTERSDGPRIFFVEHRGYFNRPGLYGEAGVDYPDNAIRFALFSRACVAALPRVAKPPMLVHAHDWHTALAPVYLRGVPGVDVPADPVTTVLSVHNPGYQGHFPAELVPELGLPWSLFNFTQLEWYGQLNLLKGGLVFSDFVVTVSPTQAEELRTPGGGFGLHDVFRELGGRLVGVLNGIDHAVWDPANDPQITRPYTPADFEGKRRCKAALQRTFGLPQRKRVPLFGMTGRMVAQKGLDLILGAPSLLESDVQIVFLGSGDPRYEDALTDLALAAPERIGVQLDFTDRLEHRLMAGADMFLMPSLYEPCGLTQMRAQRYGALPIGRRVGGLADTIEDGVTGFLFDPYTPAAFEDATRRALVRFMDQARWRRMMRDAMARDFSWDRSTGDYLAVYRQALAHAA
ncbi:MAG TPA: glycogen/starch synthase [Gemmatimonadales bacterium]